MADNSEIFQHDIEVEQALLGAILIDNGALASLPDVMPGHFYEPLHQGLYEAMVNAVASGRQADAASLRAYTDTCAPVADDLTATQYLGRLAFRAPRNPPLKSLAERLIDLAKRRALAGLIMDIREDIARGVDTAEILTKSEATICQVAESGGVRETLVPMKSAVEIAIGGMNLAYENPNILRGVRTGLTDLDSKLAGLMNSDLIVLAGRPSIGKTALAGTMCMAAAQQFAAESRERPRRVAFFSLEMKADQIAGRFIAERAEVSGEKLRRGNVTAQEIDRAITAAREIENLPIVFDQMGGASIAHVAMRARRLHMRQPLGLIIIDYLQLMQASKSHGSRVGEITEITNGIKALAKELDVPVLALSQLSRKVEERQDKRPQLSDLRECLPGSALVLNADTGERIPIADIARKNLRFNVWATDGAYRLVKRPITDAWSVGDKDVVEVTTSSGRVLCCTKGHRLLTDQGWQEVGALSAGALIANPRLVHPSTWTTNIDPDRAFVLGLLLGNGHIGGTPTLTMAAYDDPEIYMEPARRAFGIDPRVKPERLTDKANRILFTTGHLCGAGKNPLTSWLRDIGAWKKTAAEKRIPKALFTAQPAAISAVLRGMFQADGSVVPKANGLCTIKMTTISEGLARDVQHLLLRVGVMATVRSERHGGPRNPLRREEGRIWVVSITSADEVNAFAMNVGLIGDKGERLARWSRAKANEAGHHDRLPPAASAIVAEIKRARSLSHAAVGWRDQGKQMSRRTALALAEHLGAESLAVLATSDVVWERVERISTTTETTECFDLTVADLHNFVVDDFITHNSGAIEQDADVVMFVYRDDYYLSRAQPSEDDLEAYADWQQKKRRAEGKAEIIVAKNRQGSTGIVTCAFHGELTRFSNLELRCNAA